MHSGFMDVILLHTSSGHQTCFSHSYGDLHGGENKNTNINEMCLIHSIV
jgi:hypothetical protein